MRYNITFIDIFDPVIATQAPNHITRGNWIWRYSMKNCDSVLIPEIKARAKRLATALNNAFNVNIQHTKALEIVSQEDGYKNWSTYLATINNKVDAPLKAQTLNKLVHVQHLQVTANHVLNYLSWFRTGIEMCIPNSSFQEKMNYTVFGINEHGQEYILLSDSTVSIQHVHPIQEKLQAGDLPPVKVVYHSPGRLYTAQEAFEAAERWKSRTHDKRPLTVINTADYSLHLIAIRMDAFDSFTRPGCARAVIMNQQLLTEEALIQGEFGDYELLKEKLTKLIEEDAELADLVTVASEPSYFINSDTLKMSPAFS